MAQNRYYSSTAVLTSLSGGITSSDLTMQVASVTGFPSSFPYTLIIDRDAAGQEIVKVTAIAGTTLTIVRGQDGTSAVAHTTGTKVEHGVSAQDFNEPQAHLGNAGAHVPTVGADNTVLTASGGVAGWAALPDPSGQIAAAIAAAALTSDPRYTRHFLTMGS